ncbi:MAG: hypothetical protein HY685_03220 [Chloroflexi bacterium]|nr:hypothetical protein [Chloroflexota bacterium]
MTGAIEIETESRRLQHALSDVIAQAVAPKRNSELLQAALQRLADGDVRGGLEKLAASLRRIDLKRASTSPPKLRDFLGVLTQSWAALGALYAIFEGILPSRLSEAEFGVQHCIAAKRFAEEAGLSPPKLDIKIKIAEAEEAREDAREFKRAVDELNTMIRLLSIEDPFEGWRVLREEISKVWPAGVSAEDAIREQRD